MKWTKFLHRLSRCQEDPAQNTAFWHIIKFFLLMVVLTLLARGLAGTSMARVELGSPVQHIFVHSIQTTGSVTPQGRSLITVPAGLLVAQLPVQPGTAVEAGTVLVRFDEKTLENTLLRKDAQLQQLHIQAETLLDPQKASRDGITTAQTQRDRAYSALEQAKGRVSDAVRALEHAQQELLAAREQLASAQESTPETDPTEPSREQTIQQAQAAVTEAELQVQIAEGEKAAAEAALEMAQYTAADAQTHLEQAQNAYDEASKQALRTNESNAAAADLIQLDIETLLSEIDALEGIRSSGCCLVAEEAGTVTELSVIEGMQTTGFEQISIVTARDGSLLIFQVTAEAYEQLLEHTPSLKISQGIIADEAVLALAHREMAADGSVTFRIPLSSSGWSAQPVEVTAELSRDPYSTCVPLSALHQDGRGFFVYVFRSEADLLGMRNLAVRVDVSVLDMDDQYAAIAGDLGIGDHVIISSNKPLDDKDRVRVEP